MRDSGWLDVDTGASKAGLRLSKRFGLEIRAATGGDLPGLVELMRASGLSVEPITLAARFEAIQRDTGVLLVAVESGPPSGLVVVHWHASLEADWLVADITTMLVVPDDRRRGIGRLLLKAAARSARLAGCNKLRLCADTEETGLRAFCSANGFEEGPVCFVRSLRKRGSQPDD